ncbi:uncharacterized protein LOC110035379 isoform X2 [Phalaenopsis equestris]|uniref:uncharacterized protein LOC110035379 isoform X2 n=1 Tax=Phalaenopsis equestris TaxID=78828 RepID=UPI0009E4FC5D|nr:uncharacterized protein LOC110035379 isoform X2 [Phalaenopsis equestris]
MYPRLRVKELEARQEVAAACLLRVIESLSLEDKGPATSAVSDHINKGNIDSNKSYTRNPRPSFKIEHSPSTFILNEKTVKGVDEDNRSNIWADSVPRPRAVLSSPDNDDIIGTQNKRIQERRRLAKEQASDNNGKTNKHNPVTANRTAASNKPSSYINNLHNDHKVDEIRRPSNLKTRIQLKTTTNVDLKVVKAYRNTPPTESANRKKGVFNEVGACNGYPKIKCSASSNQSQEH